MASRGGLTAPMPPVFGPRSPSSSRLWSRAGASGSTAEPSVSAITDSSGPSNRSSTSRRGGVGPCEPAIHSSSIARRAPAASSQTTTPFPAARPSSFTTQAPRTYALAFSGSSNTAAWAVGTAARAMTSLANALDASMRAAAAVGPKQGTPSCASRSASPSARGASGPTTTRSGFSHSAAAASASAEPAAGTQRASSAMPAFPGIATTSRASPLRAAPCRSARTKACSRAPDPMTTTLNGISA